MKTSRQSSPRHIDGLPEDIVNEILMHLPIRDAVRTSVLSKKWRYAWTTIRHLDFDETFCNRSIRYTRYQLIRAIYQVLIRHHGPIDGFKFSLRILGSCSDIDQFIIVALKAGVKYFSLNMRETEESYRLPLSFFSYDQQLVEIVILSCVFKPPSGFKGFSKLVSLELLDVGIDGSLLSNIISNSPLLELLDFRSLTNCGRLDIDSPRLEVFTFEGLCESICLKNTPKLDFVEICTGYDVEDDALEGLEASNRVLLSGKLPAVEKLKLDHHFLKGIGGNREPRLHLNDLSHLKSLDLSICFGNLDEVLSAFYLVKNSKNLVKLRIHVHDICCTGLDLSEVEGFSDISLDHLKEVDLDSISDLKSQMQFIELILARSPLLKELIIEPFYIDDDGKRLRVFKKEVSRLHRASPVAQICYRDC